MECCLKKKGEGPFKLSFETTQSTVVFRPSPFFLASATAPRFTQVLLSAVKESRHHSSSSVGSYQIQALSVDRLVTRYHVVHAVKVELHGRTAGPRHIVQPKHVFTQRIDRISACGVGHDFPWLIQLEALGVVANNAPPLPHAPPHLKRSFSIGEIDRRFFLESRLPQLFQLRWLH